jgi:hypothetical protein
MFNPNSTVIDAFVAHTVTQFREAFPTREPRQDQILEQAARTALENLLSCDCPYHDLQHTILVTDVGQTILRGRQIARGDVTADDWLHAVVSMLFHDIGYLRGLLKDDTEDEFLIDEAGTTVTAPQGATDAYLTPYHVNRGCLYVRDWFASTDLVDVERISAYIEMTRFPVPEGEPYQQLEGFGALVRSADLIGQMADPQYLQKLTRLYAEFLETGDAARLGFASVGELRDGFPEFYYENVHPYINEAQLFLGKTQEGQQWLANLYHHIRPDRLFAETLELPREEIREETGQVVPHPVLRKR